MFFKVAWQYIKTIGLNFGMVTPFLYRSAQPSRSQLAKLKEEYGIEAVLNLRHDAGRKEREDAAANDLWYEHIPMLDTAAPTDGQVKAALKVMRSGRVVLVHCKGGRHRTGLMIAAYDVVDRKRSKRDAWKTAEKFGWYDEGDHKPIRLWFEAFDPEKFK